MGTERIVEVGTQKYTQVVCLDQPGQGGACHQYIVRPKDPTQAPLNELPESYSGQSFASIRFQNGPVKEFGVNGCHQEDLLAIVIDRLQSFQAGRFACRENALALTKCEEALHWLRHRTQAREARGVEGTNVV